MFCSKHVDVKRHSVYFPEIKKAFALSSLVPNLLASQIGEFFLLYPVDATYYFIVLLRGSTCFGHYYAHHQELTTIMLITTLVVSFLVCCRLEVRCG